MITSSGDGFSKNLKERKNKSVNISIPLPVDNYKNKKPQHFYALNE